MKKIFYITNYILFAVFYTQPAFASQLGNLTPPPATNITIVYTVINFINLAISFAILIFLAMFIWASIEWMTSAGDKMALERAKGRITNAAIGLVLLGISWTIFSIVRSATYTGPAI